MDLIDDTLICATCMGTRIYKIDPKTHSLQYLREIEDIYPFCMHLSQSRGELVYKLCDNKVKIIDLEKDAQNESIIKFESLSDVLQGLKMAKN